MDHIYSDPCKGCDIRGLCKPAYQCKTKVMYKTLSPKLTYSGYVWLSIAIIIICGYMIAI